MGKKIKTTEAGFTLIETFVAITILVFAIIGPLQLFSQSIVDSNYAKNQITGFYLAAEGLDLVINKKENNLRVDPAKPWLDGLETSGAWDFDPVSLEVKNLNYLYFPYHFQNSYKNFEMD
jgi:type II secretory pathway pseudopilin PulG